MKTPACSTLLRCLALCLFLVILMTGTTCWADEQRVYTFSYSSEVSLYKVVRDRIKVVYERLGIPVEFVALPTKRSLVQANEGAVDGEVGRPPVAEGEYENLRRVNVKVMDLD